MKNKKYNSNLIRNFVFGVEDSLVSTVGLISGIAVAGVQTGTILLTGLILVFVEAFSMAVGSLLSENSVEEYDRRKEVPLTKSLAGGVVMFFSYIVSGLLVILPYLIYQPDKALKFSVTISLLALFAVGMVSARLSGLHVLKRGVIMALVGGGAILIGVVVGKLVQNL